MKKAIVQNTITWIEKKDKSGFIQRIPFLGNIKLKPKGWKISKNQDQ